jgi:hypothetical protein
VQNSKPTTTKGGVWQRLLDALTEKPGNLVSNEKLIEVSGQHNYARRVRELRAEGWDIVYSSSPMGYTLRSLTKSEKDTDVYINLKLRQKVLERDQYICQLCFHKGGEKYADGEVVRMEVDHIKPLKQGGKTVEENLWTLCSRCNAGKKSLFDYPETIKNKILSVNLSEGTRKKLSELSLKSGRTINDLVTEAIDRGIEKLK